MLNLFTYQFKFDRELHLKHYAIMEANKESKKADFYKKQSEGYKGEITRLKNQLINK